MKKILLVDDDPISLQILDHFLAESGFSSHLANDGDEAYQLLVQNPAEYQLILADRIMPHVDALELLHRLQKSKNLAYIPMIVITGIADREEMIDVIKAGAYDFLTKPIEKNLLIAVVKRVITETRQ